MNKSAEVYGLLASAVAGRPLDVVDTDDAQSWCDGRTVYLAATDLAHAPVTVCVHAALSSAGSLEPAVARRLLGRPAVARRFLVAEADRAVRWCADIVPMRVRRAVAAVGAPATDTVAESLRLALGRGRVPSPPAAYGALRPRRLLAAGPGAGAAPTAGDQQAPRVEIELPELDEDGESDELGALAKLFSSPLGGTGPVSRLIQKLLGMGRQPGTAEDDAAGGELRIGSARWVEQGTNGALAAAVPQGIGVEQLAEARVTAIYPEWDERVGRYRVDWCRVVEVAAAGDGDPLAAPPRDDDLRRRLTAVSLGRQRCRRQLQGDDLDLDAVVDAELRRRSGAAPGEEVYVASLRRGRDLGVLVLLDVSGSTNDRAPDGVAIHERQRDVALRLVDTFNVVGDRVAAYAFHSLGRARVHLVKLKSFHEALDGRFGVRLGALEPIAFTRLGAAIRHATHLLVTGAGTHHRLLVVLSDGFAYDDGYEGLYAEADARRALVEARSRGVGCVCLTAGAPTGADVLDRVFGSASYASAPTFDELRGSLAVLLRGAIRSAEGARRRPA